MKIKWYLKENPIFFYLWIYLLKNILSYIYKVYAIYLDVAVVIVTQSVKAKSSSVLFYIICHFGVSTSCSALLRTFNVTPEEPADISSWNLWITRWWWLDHLHLPAQNTGSLRYMWLRVEHCVSSAKVVGSIPRETHTDKTCKSKASAKCINEMKMSKYTTKT